MTFYFSLVLADLLLRSTYRHPRSSDLMHHSLYFLPGCWTIIPVHHYCPYIWLLSIWWLELTPFQHAHIYFQYVSLFTYSTFYLPEVSQTYFGLTLHIMVN